MTLKPKLTIPAVLACSLAFSGQALAQTTSETPADAAPTQAPLLTPEILTERLNASDICTPLTLNLNDITSLFGVAIPSYLPIDPNLRWDQNAHTVENFIANEGSFEATIKIGCQPSSNGVILEFLGLTADKLRLPGQSYCAGAFGENGELIGNDCTIEGRIVPYVGKTIDLESRVERGLTTEIPTENQTAQ
ncbi:hypothetical protein [Fulvimarina sp. MAC8]|uniref:hypothetical protein n=1 Tax=Fulvimarina sp. MAC8 TaxID=3162874 RepID=UPI0032EB0D5C